MPGDCWDMFAFYGLNKLPASDPMSGCMLRFLVSMKLSPKPKLFCLTMLRFRLSLFYTTVCSRRDKMLDELSVMLLMYWWPP